MIDSCSLSDERRLLFKEWRRLINLPSAELRAFLDSSEGQAAGLSRGEARRQGIRRGRDSGFAILRMREKLDSSGNRHPACRWTRTDWEWARRQVSFVKRMSGVRGPVRKGGQLTRKGLALKVWGRRP